MYGSRREHSLRATTAIARGERGSTLYNVAGGLHFQRTRHHRARPAAGAGGRGARAAQSRQLERLARTGTRTPDPVSK